MMMIIFGTLGNETGIFCYFALKKGLLISVESNRAGETARVEFHIAITCKYCLLPLYCMGKNIKIVV
jgi:hypothetical protein